MISLPVFVTFLLAVTGLFLTPGPNMVFVVSHSVAHGRRAGLAAALGIAVADFLLTMASSAGLAALTASWPPGFDVLRWCGAAYLAYLAVLALRPRGAVAVGQAAHLSQGRIFATALVNCLCNPKALLFFALFLPQFVDAGRGGARWQLAVLGVVLSVYALLFNALLAHFGWRVGALLQTSARVLRWQGRLLAGVFAALALHLLWQAGRA
jgi:threonine/homoserine/homoserine lactone efflux protein